MKQDNTTPQQKSVRELAIEWWNKQSREYKNIQFAQYKKETFSPASHFTGLTGREIESIYKNLGLSERAIKESAPIPEYLVWWNGLGMEGKIIVTDKYYPHNRYYQNSEEEKQEMYKAENPSQPKKGGQMDWDLYPGNEADNSGEGFNGIKLVASKRGGSIVVYDEPEERITGDFWYDTSNEKEKEQLVNHIIKCVNAHDELKSALTMAIARIGFYEQYLDGKVDAWSKKDEAKEILNKIKQ